MVTSTTTTTDPSSIVDNGAVDKPNIEPTKETLNIRIEFSGGLELLFNNESRHDISLPALTNLLLPDSSSPQAEFHSPSPLRSKPGLTSTSVSWKLKDLIPWICDNLMVDSRREMFVLADGSIRPGILVLVNDADWELEGEEMYELQEGDCILFVSTLHGG